MKARCNVGLELAQGLRLRATRGTAKRARLRKRTWEERRADETPIVREGADQMPSSNAPTPEPRGRRRGRAPAGAPGRRRRACVVKREQILRPREENFVNLEAENAIF